MSLGSVPAVKAVRTLMDPPISRYSATGIIIDPVAGRVRGDWGFRNDDTSELTHGIHPYPARLVPQLARKILGGFDTGSELVVWDPFCGSGTVLLESMRRGYRSIGFDLNPFACLLARAKTRVIAPVELGRWSDLLDARLRGASADAARKSFVVSLDDFRLDAERWWIPTVRRDLGFIRNAIREVMDLRKHSGAAQLADVAFARTVRQVSNQRPNEFKRYRRPANEIRGFRPDTVGVFLTNWTEVCRMVRSLAPMLVDAPRPEVRVADSSVSRPKQPVDLIVTSPPYGDSSTTVAYGQFSSLAMEWLPNIGGDWHTIDRESLGGHPKSSVEPVTSPTLDRVMTRIREKDRARASDVNAFFSDMRICLKNFHEALVPEGAAFLVIGDRTVRGETIPNSKILQELAEEVGFQHHETVARRVFFKVIPYHNNPVGRSGGGMRAKTIGKEHIVGLLAR
jgi:site-specific DNA-methyltransferase (cytosine-N4-specific)